MHGHGYTQPVKQPPHPAWLVLLRVLFVVLGIFTIGLFSWAMLLRLALVTRRPLDWGLFVASLVAVTLGLVLVGVEPGDEIHTAGGWTGMALLFGTLVAAIAYYLSADVRHFHQLRYGGYAPQPAPVPAPSPAYGYPHPHTQPQPHAQAPYTATTLPQAPAPIPQPQTPLAQPPAPHTPPPPPQRPAPARIDQVRAELDELSDYLRRQDGQPGGNHEGGR